MKTKTLHIFGITLFFTIFQCMVSSTESTFFEEVQKIVQCLYLQHLKHNALCAILQDFFIFALKLSNEPQT